jgi:hypothetical protein
VPAAIEANGEKERGDHDPVVCRGMDAVLKDGPDGKTNYTAQLNRFGNSAVD